MLQVLRTVQSRSRQVSGARCSQEHAPSPGSHSWFVAETCGPGLENHLMAEAYTENAHVMLGDAGANERLDVTWRAENEGGGSRG